MDSKKLSTIFRSEYTKKSLDDDMLIKNPFDQFNQWFQGWVQTNPETPNAMTLSTATNKGTPSSRIVLLKHFDQEKLTFFTDYTSKKGQDLKNNPIGSLLFFWDKHEQTVRIEGTIKKTNLKESDEYFFSRPKNSQIAAIISNQSQKINSQKELLEKFKKAKEDYKNKPIIRPKEWGGYALTPNYFEFWQGKPNRLHDRISYQKEDSHWIISRLYP